MKTVRLFRKLFAVNWISEDGRSDQHVATEAVRTNQILNNV